MTFPVSCRIAYSFNVNWYGDFLSRPFLGKHYKAWATSQTEELGIT